MKFNRDCIIDTISSIKGEKLFFGLGFIQVKINKVLRYHFYHPELISIMPDEEIHNHRYDFTSSVLKGALNQTFYSVTPSDKEVWVQRSVSCDPDKPAPTDELNVDVIELSSFCIREGSKYTIKKDTYHKVNPVAEPTITLVQRHFPIEKEYAQVVSRKSSDVVCPFSPKMDEHELFEWIDKICRS